MSLLQLSSGFAPPQYHSQPSLGGEPLPQVTITIVVDIFIKIIRFNIITVGKINISVIIVLIVAGGDCPPKGQFCIHHKSSQRDCEIYFSRGTK